MAKRSTNRNTQSGNAAPSTDLGNAAPSTDPRTAAFNTQSAGELSRKPSGRPPCDSEAADDPDHWQSGRLGLVPARLSCWVSTQPTSLSRYVFRTAITNNRIVSMNNGLVTFSYRKNGEQRDRKMTLPVFEFLRRFLQHVLPKRLQKIRHYGFLSRRSNIDLDDVREAILESLRDVDPDLELEEWSPPVLPSVSNDGQRCPNWGGRLIFEKFHRIRPPPLSQRDNQHRCGPENSF